MKTTRLKYAILLRKTATIMLVLASFAAFATLGKGGERDSSSHSKSLLSVRTPVSNYRNFTLRSGYQYRGSVIINTAPEYKYITLNRVITYQKGNQTYILPMKKKVLLDKVNFNLNK